MTQVRLSLSRPGPDGINRPVSGVFQWQQSTNRVEGGVTVTDEPFYQDVRPGQQPVIDVDPTDGWAWIVTEWIRGKADRKRYLAVPASVTVVDYADLVEVDPKTLLPPAQPAGVTWIKVAGPPMTQDEYDDLPVHEGNVLYLIHP